jgi:hypothetical protein
VGHVTPDLKAKQNHVQIICMPGSVYTNINIMLETEDFNHYKTDSKSLRKVTRLGTPNLIEVRTLGSPLESPQILCLITHLG